MNVALLGRSGVMVSLVLSVFALAACGGEAPPPAAPAAAPEPAPAPAPAPEPAPAPAVTPAPAASAAPAPAPKTSIASFALAATSGKVDKVGSGDGAYKADGVKDLVFDVEIEGAAKALLVLVSDKQGTPTGDFGADTFVGGQQLPASLAANLNQGKNTVGLAVYEGDKLVNAKDGSITLGEGKHKLALHVSSKDAPKGASYAVFAVLADDTLVKGPVAAAK